MKKRRLFLFVFLFIFIPAAKVNAKEVTVVIDPGHGGDNLGGQFENYVEKEMTMQTAIAMKQHLEQFDDVTVFLTHDNITDPDLSLTKRAEIAAEKNADFMFSLHYNKSLDNRLFGAEVWVSAFNEYYTKGVQFGEIEMQQLTDIGLFDRGIKTRLNSRGSDYYGIIQHSVENNIPCVIIEHCHMDQENDIAYLNKENAYEQFGILDAEAVAKYFNLKSTVLNEDYTDYLKQEVSIPADVVKPDLTPPDEADIAITETDNQANTAIKITACDWKSGLNYYDYSTDGGESFSPLQPWPFESSTCIFEIPTSFEEDLNVICRVYNRYDLSLTSNALTIPKSISQITPTPQIEEEDDSKDIYQNITVTNTVPVISASAKDETIDIVLLSLLIVIVIMFIFTIIFFFYVMKKKRHKRKNKR